MQKTSSWVLDWNGAVYSVKPKSTWIRLSFSVMSENVNDHWGIGLPVSW